MLTLPLEAVPAAANLFEHLAAQLRSLEHTQKKRQANSAAAKKSRTKRLNAIDLMASHINNGMTAQSAIHATAVATGIDADVLKSALPRAHKIADDKARQVRNREIMQRVAKGWTDSEIGRRYGLHKKSVARIIAGIRSEKI